MLDGFMTLHSHSTARNIVNWLFCTFVMEILLMDFNEDKMHLSVLYFWMKSVNCTAMLKFCEQDQLQNVTGWSSPNRSNVFCSWKEESDGADGFFFFLKCPMGNQINTLQRRKWSYFDIKYVFLKIAIRLQKYLNFLLGSNFCFLKEVKLWARVFFDCTAMTYHLHLF